MLKTEESRVSIIVLLSFALLLITGVYPEYVLWAAIALVAIILALGAYAALSRKTYGEPQDERSGRCSLMATRNGFLAAMVMAALVGTITRIGPAIGVDEAVRMIWGLSVAVYFLSYLAYKRVG
jgi:hypothetical protein